MKEPHVPARRVGIWIRVSTEDQAKGESPEHHEVRGRQYAAFNNWEVVEVYNLAGVSGKTVMEHPEARRMLDDIGRGHISALIFSKLARLARNTRELLEFSDLFRKHSADMVSLQERIDTSTPAGRLFYTIIAAMAQWEREETVDRTRASVAIRAKLGKTLGGPAPFGYVWKDKKLVPHPQEAPVRKLMYDLFLEHGRKKTVVRILNEAGHRTRRGARFTSKTLERLLQDPTAKGIHRGNYTTRDSQASGWVLKPEDSWIFTEVEPIVSPEVWDKCNRMLGPALRDARRRGKPAVHLFAGVLYCECGDKMYVPQNSTKYVCRKCRNKIPAVDLEAIYCEELQGYFLSPERLQEHLAQSDGVLATKIELLRVQEAELAKTKNEIERTYRLYQQGQLTVEEFGRFFRPLEERRKQLEADIPKLQAEIDFCKVSSTSAEEMMAEARTLSEHWKTMKVEEKRAIVDAITKKIVVGQSEITVNLCRLPSYENTAKRWRKGWDSNPR